MADHINSSVQADEITSMIEEFVQMWIKFESMLHKELARTYPLTNQSIAGLNHADSNYGLFYRVSSIIYPKTQLTMGELSTALSVPFSKSTRIIGWLVDNGFVKRMSDPGDRRVVRIALTENGTSLHQAISNYTKERVQVLLSSSLTTTEQEILFTLINKVAALLGNLSS
jgi:DNA-binding MarR family transcriptional regulator